MKQEPTHDLGAEERRRRERTIWRTGLLLSLAVHLLLFMAWRGTVIPESPFAARGPRAGDNRAVGGSMRAFLPLEQLTKEPFSRTSVTISLNQGVDHVALLVDGLP